MAVSTQTSWFGGGLLQVNTLVDDVLGLTGFTWDNTAGGAGVLTVIVPFDADVVIPVAAGSVDGSTLAAPVAPSVMATDGFAVSFEWSV